jgi:hypothetical protein
MTIPSPFSSDFPLKQNPYRSRLQSEIDASKNYFMVAFKPGFPLQASELNEMQEIFYTQQTLTQTLFANWHVKDLLEQNGAAMGSTPWNGCTPLSSHLVSYTTTNDKITAVFKAGWYLLKQENINGGFGIWVYNSIDTTVLTDYYYGSQETLDGDYGIIIKQVAINCTTSTTEGTYEDRTLQDSSNINVINGPCGAARLKIEIVGFGKSSDVGSGETLLPIMTAARGVDFAIVSFKNSYKIVTVPY